MCGKHRFYKIQRKEITSNEYIPLFADINKNCTYIRKPIDLTLNFDKSSTSSKSSGASVTEKKKSLRCRKKMIVLAKRRSSMVGNGYERSAKFQAKLRLAVRRKAKEQRIDNFNRLRFVHNNHEQTSLIHYEDDQADIFNNETPKQTEYFHTSNLIGNFEEIISNRVSLIPFEQVPSTINVRYSTFLATPLSFNSLQSTKTLSSTIGLRKIPHITKIDTPNRLNINNMQRKVQLSDIIFSWNEVDSSVQMITIIFGLCLFYNVFVFLKNIYSNFN